MSKVQETARSGDGWKKKARRRREEDEIEIELKENAIIREGCNAAFDTARVIR